MIPSVDTLRRASEILKEIEQLQGELAGLFGGASTARRRGRPPGKTGGPKSRRQMSPEARARIAAAAKARWARYRADKKAAAK